MMSGVVREKYFTHFIVCKDNCSSLCHCLRVIPYGNVLESVTQRTTTFNKMYNININCFLARHDL